MHNKSKTQKTAYSIMYYTPVLKLESAENPYYYCYYYSHFLQHLDQHMKKGSVNNVSQLQNRTTKPTKKNEKKITQFKKNHINYFI